ncbi:MAG: hypothetical protein JW854_02340 [Actinobacteria bacterium]|nr:hypothetical protein [Actinomycetota bacterium]
MKRGAETGKGKAILIIAMSTVALMLGSTLMLTAIRDHRVQARASYIENVASRDDSKAGNAYVHDNGFIGAGSEAGFEDAACEGMRRSIGDEKAAEQYLEGGIAVDLDLPYEPAQGAATDGAGLAVLCEPSVLPLALGGGDGTTQEGQGAEADVDYMGNEASREIWEVEEEKTEQELEAAKENLNELMEMLNDMAGIQADVFGAVFMTY